MILTSDYQPVTVHQKSREKVKSCREQGTASHDIARQVEHISQMAEESSA